MFISRVRVLAAILAASSAAIGQASATQEEPVPSQSEVTRVDGAIAFAQDLNKDATAALTKADAEEAARIEAFKTVLQDGLALETIGRFMLGESRKSMSEAQLARYESIFPDYITGQYAEQFDEIVGKPLSVIEAKEIGRRDVIVRTQFERKSEKPIVVDWRIRELRSGDRKAIDIIVSGVSIMLVKREEFSAFIATNGIDALLDRLETEASS